MAGEKYRIGQAARLLELKTCVLRFWETEFPQLRPQRTAKGQRFYSEADLTLLRRIRSLLHEQGMTIEGARRVLQGEGLSPLESLSASFPAGVAGSSSEGSESSSSGGPASVSAKETAGSSLAGAAGSSLAGAAGSSPARAAGSSPARAAGSSPARAAGSSPEGSADSSGGTAPLEQGCADAASLPRESVWGNPFACLTAPVALALQATIAFAPLASPLMTLVPGPSPASASSPGEPDREPDGDDQDASGGEKAAFAEQALPESERAPAEKELAEKALAEKASEKASAPEKASVPDGRLREALGGVIRELELLRQYVRSAHEAGQS